MCLLRSARKRELELQAPWLQPGVVDQSSLGSATISWGPGRGCTGHNHKGYRVLPRLAGIAEFGYETMSATLAALSKIR
ncbi:MAG: hypothetical protein HC769_18025 [Cyanobacteria bacterium CRU_2_1]|nr:hypothetical protein [Cyanobacteria bacterium CRU_2_1]